MSEQIMNRKELVVRIIQPAEHPQPPRISVQEPPIVEEGVELTFFSRLARRLGMVGLTSLLIITGFILFAIGFNFRDVLILVSVPLAVGAVTGYVTLG
jgi:hypothetical protein